MGEDEAEGGITPEQEASDCEDADSHPTPAPTPPVIDISTDKQPIERNFNHHRQADLDYGNPVRTKPSAWYTARGR